MGKLLILCGAILILVGLLMEFSGRIPYLGRMPGDVVVENKNFRFYFPIVTSIILSVVISLVIYIINKLKG